VGARFRGHRGRALLALWVCERDWPRVGVPARQEYGARVWEELWLSGHRRYRPQAWVCRGELVDASLESFMSSFVFFHAISNSTTPFLGDATTTTAAAKWIFITGMNLFARPRRVKIPRRAFDIIFDFSLFPPHPLLPRSTPFNLSPRTEPRVATTCTARFTRALAQAVTPLPRTVAPPP
jgi:hypothetical protein